VDPDVAAWAAAHARCNRHRCTPEEIRLMGWIAGAALGIVGLVITLSGAVRLRRPARPGGLAMVWDVLSAVQKAAASGNVRVTGGGRHVIDARGDPALREAVLSALRAHGIPVDPAKAAAGAGLPTPRPAAAPASPPAPAAPAPAAAASAPSTRPAGDRLDRLEQLGQLRDAGVLTAEEYDALRRRVLTGP
jgi:hypothetical protein